MELHKQIDESLSQQERLLRLRRTGGNVKDQLDMVYAWVKYDMMSRREFRELVEWMFERS